MVVCNHLGYTPPLIWSIELEETEGIQQKLQLENELSLISKKDSGRLRDQFSITQLFKDKRFIGDKQSVERSGTWIKGS